MTTTQDNELKKEVAEQRATLLSNIDYQIELTLTKNSDTYEGRCVLNFDLNNLEFNKLTIDFIYLEIQKIELNHERVFLSDNLATGFILDKNWLKVGRNELRVKYLNKFDNTGSGFHKFLDAEDGEIYLHTDFEPFDAHRLFPCFDQPDLKAQYKLSVTGPKDWIYLHNSKIESEELLCSNSKLSIFEKTSLFSTYLFALVAGPHSRWTDQYHGIPLGIYCRRSLEKYVDHEALFSITKESFSFLEQYFDIEYPYKKYDQVFVPEFNFGAMENVGCVTYAESYIFRGKKLYKDYLDRANTFFHEMVHMWFGNLVTMRWWNDLWLNESFADYISYLAMSHGKLFPDSFEYFFTRKEWAYRQDQLSTTHPIVGNAADTAEAFANFDGISYSKGAAVLKQLNLIIGEENFRNGIRLYLDKYREKNTDLRDFLSSMAAVSEIDVILWSKQWLETTGVNTIQVKRTKKEDTVLQSPSKTNLLLRDHSLAYEEYGLKNGLPSVVGRGIVQLKGNRTCVNLKKETKFMLPNAEDHGFIKIMFGDSDLKFLEDFLSDIQNRFSRRIIWGNLYQMVKDNILCPNRYLDFVEKHCLHEVDSSVCESQLFNKARLIISLYLNYNNRCFWEKRLFSLFRERFLSESNMEKKRSLLNMLIFLANDRKSLGYLRDLFTGVLVVKDCKIDQEKRWEILTKLCLYGYEGYSEMLTSEIKNDESDLGRKKAYQAKASLPRYEIKEFFWRDFVQNKMQLSTDYLRYGMSGFLHVSQQEILRPYVDKFFAILLDIYKKRDTHFSLAFCRFLFPSIFSPELILKKTNEFVVENDDDMPMLCRKALTEHCDELGDRIQILKNQEMRS